MMVAHSTQKLQQGFLCEASCNEGMKMALNRCNAYTMGWKRWILEGGDGYCDWRLTACLAMLQWWW